MKIQKIIFAAALGFTAVCLAASCKFAKNKNGGSLFSSSKSDADSIIGYNNALVDMNDAHDSYMKDLNNYVQNVQKGLKNPNSPFAFIGAGTVFERPYVRDYHSANPLNPPTAFASDDRNFFKTNVGLLSDTYNKIKDAYKSLKDYIAAQDYKDDKGAKGYTLIDSMTAMAKKYYAAEDMVMAKLDPIAENAERVILQDHPLKNYIFAMKDDLAAMEKIDSAMDAAGSNYKAVAATVQAAYDALDAANKQHSAMKPADNSKYSMQNSYFKSFNGDVGDYIIQLRKIMRDDNASGSVANNDVDALTSKKESARGDYNSYVKTN